MLKHANTSVSTDDMQMATSYFKISELQNQLAEDIENVIQWMADNNLLLNVLKTDFIIVVLDQKWEIWGHFVYYGSK